MFTECASLTLFLLLYSQEISGLLNPDLDPLTWASDSEAKQRRPTRPL